MSKPYAGLLAGSMIVMLHVSAVQAEALEEVVVTAKYLEQTLPQQLARYGTRVDVVTRESVTNAIYVDVAQALQALTPGLFVQNKNGPFDYADISLLGSRTSDVLWLIDGVRINNRLYAGTPPNDTLPSGILERVEVLEGGQALFYGTQATAGAINVVTRSFTDDLHLGVTVAGDTNESRHVDAYWSDAFNGHHVVLYATKDDSDGYRAFRREDYEPSSTHRKREYDLYTVGGKYAYDFTDAVRIGASYQHTEGDLDFAHPYRAVRDVNTRNEDLATAKFDYDVTQNVSLYLKGYYHRWHTSYDTVYNDLQSPGDTIVLYDNAVWGFDDRGINALARLSFGPGVEYYVGYDLQRYGGMDEVLRIEPQKEQTQALFAQVRTTPELLPRTHFSAGMRYNDPDVGESATIFNVTGQFDFTPSLFAKLGVGTNFRLPTAEELFADDPQDERGNPNLKPERSKSLNLSIGGRANTVDGEFHWELVGYARDIRDLIDYDTFDVATGQSVFGNVAGTVKVRGAEVVVGARVAATWSADFSFAHNSSKQDGGDQLARIPENLAKAVLDFAPKNLPFGATLALNYTGHTYAPVGDDRLQYGDYWVVDFSGRYFFDAARRQRLVVSVQNVFDEQYGRPSRGCRDTPDDGPYDCSIPYTYVNLGLPRTLRASYTYAF